MHFMVGASLPIFYLETRGGNFARERLMKRATTHRVFVKMGLWDGTLSERINRAFTSMQEAEIIVQWDIATPSSRVHLTRCLLACFAISLLLPSLAFALGTFRTILKTQRPLSILHSLAGCLVGILNFHSAVIQP